MIDKEAVLALFRDRTRKPMRFKDIVASLGLGSRESRALKKVLRQMLRSGELVLTKKGHYGSSEEMDMVTGFFEAHREGYGFVVPDKPGQRDLFIPARAARAAMDGDMVVAKVENAQKRVGRVVRVTQRAHKMVAGRVDLSGKVCYVKPKSRSISFDIYIPPKEKHGARHGQSVVVEILEYPTETRAAIGRIVKTLKKPHEPRELVETIIEEFSLPKRFPSNVRSEARALGFKGASRRKDLRGLNTVTIDGERAKDFDDAISIARSPEGYRLWVHIADVGFYVGWDSDIDVEARKRATSVYFPDRVVPMLPKELSEELCSLKPRVDRHAFTVEMDFDRRGRRSGARFYPSLINSDERMTYTAVSKVIVDRDRKVRKRYDRLVGDFELMGELCSLIRKRRFDRGSLDFDLPEPEVLLDMQCRPEAILKAERNFAHFIVEEFMIAANEAVAEHLYGLGVPSIYRIHEEPDISKTEDVLKLARPFVPTLKKPGPKALHRLLRAIKGKPEEEALTYVVLRSLKQARYSVDNVGHFGLASKCYTHFTSPIRRYPDLVVHRILREVLRKKGLPERREKELRRMLPDMALQSSRLERVAEDSERDAINAMRAWFMKDKVGEKFEARVVGISPYGMKVRLKDIYVEGFIHVSSLTDDFYQYNERAFTLRGRHTGRKFRFGHDVEVRLDRVDMDEKELVFGLLS